MTTYELADIIIAIFFIVIVSAWTKLVTTVHCFWISCRSKQTRTANTQTPSVNTVDKATQSQTTYTWWTQNPRFKPLGAAQHGAW